MNTIFHSPPLAFAFLLFICQAHGAEFTPRPITGEDKVLAVYTEDWGRAFSGEPRLILAIWADGHVVWSDDRLKGGPPYHAGQIDPKRFASLLQRLAHDGVFADKDLSQAQFGPDSQFTVIMVKSGKLRLKMQSWHELFEANQKVVADNGAITPLDGRRRLEVLKGNNSEYLFFRMVWNEIRLSAAQLIPSNGTPTQGKVVLEKGIMSWREESVETQRSK